MKIITGGQSGVDQAAIKAAEDLCVPVGGFVPKGWLTEDGPAPWLERHGLFEHASANYAARTVANLKLADYWLVLCMGIEGYHSRGTNLVRAQHAHHMRNFVAPVEKAPRLTILDASKPGISEKIPALASGILEHSPDALFVGGNRESRFPGVHDLAYEFLYLLFGAIK